MRQGQNPKRARGRGRRPQNQVNRTMDSNGPDVKIRGTAQHIFEKYQTLARDAQSSGDRVGAENYLQHAEHYFRLILQFQAQNGDDARQSGDFRQMQNADTAEDEDGAEDEQPRAAQEKAPGRQQRAQGGEAAEGEGASGQDETAASGEDQPKRRAPRRRRAPRQNRDETGAASGEGDEQPPAPQSPAEAAQ